MVRVDKSKCRGCAACVNVCPREAITLVKGIAQIDSSKCIECLRCINVCPAGAISSDRQKNNASSSSFPKTPFAGRGLPGGGGGFGRGRGGGRGMGRGGGRGF